MVRAGFVHTNHLALAVYDEVTESRKELINMLTYLELLEKDSTSVDTAPTDASSLSSGSTPLHQSENVNMEQQYQPEMLKMLQIMAAKTEKLDKNIDEKKGSNNDNCNN